MLIRGRWQLLTWMRIHTLINNRSMCFNKNVPLYSGNAWLTQVATDDINVYKYLIKKKLLFFNKYYAPVINRFSYKKGKTYYSPLNIAIHHHEKNSDNFAITVEEGFHSFIHHIYVFRFLSEYGIKFRRDFVIGKFIIPKGTTYIKNNEQIVSDRIKFIGVIPLKDLDT